MFLKKIDLYGCDFKPTVFGQKKYKTVHGGVFTMFTVCLMGVIVFLFGSDFLYKKNPKVFIVEEIPDPSEYPIVKVSNQNFSILIKQEDNLSKMLQGEDLVLYPQVEYSKLVRNEQKAWEVGVYTNIIPKICSQTSNRDNPNIQQYDLTDWLCIDWDEVEEIIGEEPHFGGKWEGNVVWTIRLFFKTCPLDPSSLQTDFTKCSSFDQINKAINRGDRFFSFVFPNFNFVPSDYDEPIRMAYEYKYYQMSPQVSYRKDLFLSHEVVRDDRGWILEDFIERPAVKFSRDPTTVRVLTKENFEENPEQYYFLGTMAFESSTTYRYRSYIKVQELFANIGGILKLVVLFMQFISQFLAERLRNIEVVKFIESKNRSNISNITIRGGGINSSSASVKPKTRAQNAKLNGPEGFFSLIGFYIFRQNSVYYKETAKKFRNLSSEMDLVNFIQRNNRPAVNR